MNKIHICTFEGLPFFSHHSPCMNKRIFQESNSPRVSASIRIEFITQLPTTKKIMFKAGSQVAAVSAENQQNEKSNNKLLAFLMGTIDPHSPLTRLRGQEDVLRIVWRYACSEWWSLHLQPYEAPILPHPEDYYAPVAAEIDPHAIPDLRTESLFKRKRFFDCPLAIIDSEVEFPAPYVANNALNTASNTNITATGTTTTENTVSEPLYVNMMPFDLLDPIKTLPEYLHGYLPLINRCVQYTRMHIDRKRCAKKHDNQGYRRPQDKPRTYLVPPWNSIDTSRGFTETGDNRDNNSRKIAEKNRNNTVTDKNNTADKPALNTSVHSHSELRQRIAYITVDERPFPHPDAPQRRGGVHVESPGAMRSESIADKSQYTPDLSFYHPWGLGRAVDEFLEGGIYLASNVSHSTAVWNMKVHDTFGDIIGTHGSLERMRDLLGAPSKLLEAGELIWLSDRTPHESLPLTRNSNYSNSNTKSNNNTTNDNTDINLNRQFFRLVVGEIAFWFSEHNTANPTGFQVPSWVPIVQGNKFAHTSYNNTNTNTNTTHNDSATSISGSSSNINTTKTSSNTNIYTTTATAPVTASNASNENNTSSSAAERARSLLRRGAWSRWECGSHAEIALAKQAQSFRALLYKHGIGFLADDLLKLNIVTREQLSAKERTEVEKLIENLDEHLYSGSTKMFMRVAIMRVIHNY